MRKRDNNIITGYQNQRIEIMNSQNTKLPAGGSDPNNTVYWETNAHITRNRDFRTSEGHVTDIELSYRVSVRYRNDKNINNNMLLKWRGIYWVIYGYNPDVIYQDYVVFNITQNNLAKLVTS